MRRPWLSLWFWLATLGVGAAGRAHAVPVIAFGDSWANESASSLYDALAAAGHPGLLVDNQGVGGATARHYAVVDPNAILNAIAANPDVEWIYLSVAGNDVIDHYTNRNPGTTAADNEMHIEIILDRIYAAVPDVRVVMFGYTYTNFVQSAACMQQAETFFGVGVTQAQINAILLAEVGVVMQTVAARYPNVTYVPLWDVLQLDAGQVSDPAAPSPAVYFRDCFHLDPPGYRVVHDALVAAYWDSAPSPTAAFADDGAPRCVDSPIVFTDQSVSAARAIWRVDGADAGEQPTLTVTATRAGSYVVRLTAFNGAWTDTAEQTIGISPCVDAGVPDAGPLDTGAPDTGAGPVDAGDRPDARPFDSGVLPFDSGVHPDGTVGPQPDAGTPDMSPDAGTAPASWELGGGCRTARPEVRNDTAAVVWCVLIGVAGFLKRRRARR